MLETLHVPEDLESCQRQLRQLAQAYAGWQRVYEELLDTCASVQDSQQQLQQERDELQLTIQRLLRQLYGRRSERREEAEGQKHLDFGDAPTDAGDEPGKRRRPARAHAPTQAPRRRSASGASGSARRMTSAAFPPRRIGKRSTR